MSGNHTCERQQQNMSVKLEPILKVNAGESSTINNSNTQSFMTAFQRGNTVVTTSGSSSDGITMGAVDARMKFMGKRQQHKGKIQIIYNGVLLKSCKQHLTCCTQLFAQHQFREIQINSNRVDELIAS